MKTSIADQTPYVYAAYEAALSDEAFENFKQNPHYQQILEHTSKEHASEYITSLLVSSSSHTWQIANQLKNGLHNDRYGNPTMYKYSISDEIVASPSSLRYAHTLSVMLSLGVLSEGDNIAEIGGGYGGQAVTINQFVPNCKFTMVDLQEAIALQKRYMETNGLHGNRFVDPFSVETLKDEVFDLVISNYALSECNREIQTSYINNILMKAKHGFLTWNFISEQFGVTTLTVDELKRMLPHKVRVQEEKPKTGFNNVVIWW